MSRFRPSLTLIMESVSPVGRVTDATDDGIIPIALSLSCMLVRPGSNPERYNGYAYQQPVLSTPKRSGSGSSSGGGDSVPAPLLALYCGRGNGVLRTSYARYRAQRRRLTSSCMAHARPTARKRNQQGNQQKYSYSSPTNLRAVSSPPTPHMTD